MRKNADSVSSPTLDKIPFVPFRSDGYESGIHLRKESAMWHWIILEVDVIDIDSHFAKRFETVSVASRCGRHKSSRFDIYAARSESLFGRTVQAGFLI